MLFKPYHLPMIRSGSKTVTRREWAENYSRPNEGSVQIASDEMFTSDDEADCYIHILDVYDQPLGEMTNEDAQKEGDYESLEEFKEGYAKVYGEGAWDSDQEVAVVEFEYVGQERPGEQEQKQLVTDGGRDSSVNGISRERAEELLDQLDDETLLVYPLGPAKVWAYQRRDYLMLVRDRGKTYSQSSTTSERVVEHLGDAFWNELFGTEPSLVDIADVPDTIRRAAR